MTKSVRILVLCVLFEKISKRILTEFLTTRYGIGFVKRVDLEVG